MVDLRVWGRASPPRRADGQTSVRRAGRAAGSTFDTGQHLDRRERTRHRLLVGEGDARASVSRHPKGPGPSSWRDSDARTSVSRHADTHGRRRHRESRLQRRDSRERALGGRLTDQRTTPSRHPCPAPAPTTTDWRQSDTRASVSRHRTNTTDTLADQLATKRRQSVGFSPCGDRRRCCGGRRLSPRTPSATG